jgi:hypothetical protein
MFACLALLWHTTDETFYVLGLLHRWAQREEVTWHEGPL